MYLAKLDEEANYLTVPEEVEEDICTCPTCTVSDGKCYTFTDSNFSLFQASYGVLYEEYMQKSKPTETIDNVTLSNDNEMMYAGYMLQSKNSDTTACNNSSNVDTVTENTAKIMKSILYEKDDNICVIM